MTESQPPYHEAGISGSAGLWPAPGDGLGWRSRGYLPHFDRPGLLQMLTFRLIDALPAAVLAELARSQPAAVHRRVRLEALLDAGHGSCYLRDPEIALIIQKALLHFDGERYRLIAWVIMPNHVHVVIETVEGWPLSTVLRSWKPFTANAVNRLLGRAGALWQPEYYDRAIRDGRHLRTAVAYVHQNPVKAGLVLRAEDWRFSSALA